MRAIWSAIVRVYKRAGHAEARAIMSGFYFVVVAPIAIATGARRRRAMLSLDAGTRGSAWLDAADRSPREHSSQQY